MKRVVVPALVALAGSATWIRDPQPVASLTASPASAPAVEREIPESPPATRVAAGNRSFVEAKAGDAIAVLMPGGKARTGRVHLMRNDGSWRRLGGTLSTGESFSLATRGNELCGWIQSRPTGRAWRVSTDASGAPVFAEQPLRELVCMELPRPRLEPADTLTEQDLRAPVPLLSSRPGVDHVLYLDFDGAVVQDPDWDGGNTIDAPAARLSTKGIQNVWQRVAGDYAAFNVDVTTNAARYDAADVGKRMRCIITRNDSAAPGAGGVAYVDSFSDAGNFFSSDIPAWVFIDRSVDACAEAISHELGHSVGLEHDGRDSPSSHREYYSGQGRGPTGWAPIMGVSYNRRLSQWSKGEYRFANNQEDDIARIARAKNGFGFAADEAGGTTGSAAELASDGTLVNQDGIILTDADVDVFRLEFAGGKIQIRAVPGPGEGNIDILLELLDSTGTIIDRGNPRNSLSASVSKRNRPAGTYYLRVRGTGKGNSLKTGYTAYGSIGTYHLSGKILGLVNSP